MANDDAKVPSVRGKVVSLIHLEERMQSIIKTLEVILEYVAADVGSENLQVPIGKRLEEWQRALYKRFRQVEWSCGTLRCWECSIGQNMACDEYYKKLEANIRKRVKLEKGIPYDRKRLKELDKKSLLMLYGILGGDVKAASVYNKRKLERKVLIRQKKRERNKG